MTGHKSASGGRPGGVAALRELALRYGVEAIKRLVTEMNEGDTSNARIAAAKAILDRALGKPTQPLASDTGERPVISNEERREQLRALVAKAFTQVINDHPELAPRKLNTCLRHRHRVSLRGQSSSLQRSPLHPMGMLGSSSDRPSLRGRTRQRLFPIGDRRGSGVPGRIDAGAP
jgi:hypothetical protein